MAASKDLKDYVDELTKCPICLEDLVDPKSLPCVHTFCLRCIRDHCRDSPAPGDRVNCPVCRCSFAIPVGGVEQLPGNFLLRGLTEAKKASDEPDEKGRSADDNIGKTASRIGPTPCNGCGQNACYHCARPHEKTPRLDIVPGECGLRNEDLTPQGNECRQHPGNRFDARCYECDEHGCEACNALNALQRRQRDINDWANDGYGLAALPQFARYPSASVARGMSTVCN